MRDLYIYNYIKVVISGPSKPDSRKPYMWQNSGKGIFFATVEAISGSGAPLTLSGKIGGVDP